MYWINCIFSYTVCPRKLHLQSEASHKKHNSFQAPPNWDFIYILLQERIHCDFSLMFTRFFFFSVHYSSITFFPGPPVDCCDILNIIVSLQNSVPLTLLLDCIACFLEHRQMTYFPEVLFFRFYCIYKSIQQSAGLYHHAGFFFFPPLNV